MFVDNGKKSESDVLTTANRLRLIQVDFADQSTQTRIDYLRAEIERALKTVLPHQRNEFLERLMARFPTGEVSRQPILDNQRAASGSVLEEDKLHDADFLVQSLLKIVATLSEDQKKAIDTSLVQAGLRHKVPRDLPVEVDLGRELKAKLQIDNECGLNAVQLKKLSVMLIDFILKLELLVSNTWRTMAPRAPHRPHGALAAKIGQFLCDDRDVADNQLDNDLKVLQRLIAGLIVGVSQVGRKFAKCHLAKFAPSEIRALVQWEERDIGLYDKLRTSPELRCWRKYKELAETLNEDSIEMAITRIIVEGVEAIPPQPPQKRTGRRS